MGLVIESVMAEIQEIREAGLVFEPETHFNASQGIKMGVLPEEIRPLVTMLERRSRSQKANSRLFIDGEITWEERKERDDQISAQKPSWSEIERVLWLELEYAFPEITKYHRHRNAWVVCHGWEVTVYSTVWETL